VTPQGFNHPQSVAEMITLDNQPFSIAGLCVLGKYYNPGTKSQVEDIL